jgi:nicotinamidase-related amidase
VNPSRPRAREAIFCGIGADPDVHSRGVREAGSSVPVMDRFNGLDIPESLRDVLEPATLALVVYDMQVGILAQIARGHEVLHNVGRLLAAARQRRVRTVFMRHYFMPTELAGVFQLRQAKTWQGKEHAADTRPLISRGSSGFQLAEGLEPRPTEAVLDKITMSAFEGTPLDIVLRDCGVRAYLIAGVATEVGIEPTVRHSADLGYIPVVVRDACGAGDEAAGRRALESLAFAGDAILTDTDEVCSLLAAG